MRTLTNLLAGAALLALGACAVLKTTDVAGLPDPVPLTLTELGLFGAGDTSEAQNVSGQLNSALWAMMPEQPNVSDKLIYEPYRVNGTSRRMANYLANFDFSGVAWDDKRAGTLIGPRHVIMAKHYQRPVGSELVFHRHRDQQPVKATLLRSISLRDSDVTVGLLDRSPEGCAVYPVFPAGHDWHHLLRGCTVFVCDQERKALQYDMNYLAGPHVIARTWGPQSSPYLREALISGDSGHPVFLPLGNQLVLLTLNQYGGNGTTGPNLMDVEIQTALRQALVNLGD